MNRSQGPPVHDLSSTTGLSLCSSPSTITCSVWSSGRSTVSSFDALSTILPMSTITFSSALGDDEDEITLDRQPPHSSSSFDGSSAPSFQQPQQHNHSKTSASTFALSERSLFEDPTREIDPTRKFDYAPMAPLRQQQRHQYQQELLGNQKWTAHPSHSSDITPGDINRDAKPGFIDQGGRLDVKPRMPTRSFHGDGDKDEEDDLDSNEEPTRGGPNDHDSNTASRLVLSASLHVIPPMPRTRRERLVQRLAAVQRIVDPSSSRTTTKSQTTGACRIAPIFNMNEKSDPPKLPIRTTHDDMTESVVVSDEDDDNDSGDGFACDAMDVIIPVSKAPKEQRFECEHDNDDLQMNLEKPDQQHEGRSVGSGSVQEKTIQPNPKPATRQRSKKPKPSKANTKSSTTSSKKKAVANKEAEPQEPVISNASSALMDLPAGRRRSSTGSSKGGRRAAKRSLRPRSKDPPQRFATAPASLSSSTSTSDSNQKTFISKRRVRTQKSLSSERRNRRQFVSNSLASILEDENENTTSPVREEPKAPISCPAAIETTGLEERYDSILDLENRFTSKTRSWAGTASRNLL